MQSADVDYLKFQIDHGDAQAKKLALQDLCRRHRAGETIYDPNLRAALENSINGLLLTHWYDEKVRRWALNALAKIGTEKRSLTGIQHVLSNYADEPQTIASAIAALYAIARDPSLYVRTVGQFPRELAVLAALQSVSFITIGVTGVRVNIEQASPDILKLALIIVGLDRAPENIFHPRYPNSKIVEELGTHDDPIVSQYSVWAVTENPKLGVGDLGIDLQDIERMPPNVRGWIYRLLAADEQCSSSYLEYLELGSVDPSGEARNGLADGIRGVYFDGLEELVYDWIGQEEVPEIRQNLLEHMARHCDHFVGYQKFVKETYENEPSNSPLRQRLEAAAGGTSLFGDLRRIKLLDGGDLFGYGMEITVNNKTVNNNVEIGDGAQVGAIAVGGDAKNEGDLSQIYSNDVTLKLHQLLRDADDLVSKAELESAVKREVREAIAAAHAQIEPNGLKTVVRLLRKIGSVVIGVPDQVEALGKLIEGINDVGGLGGA